jgi:ABC-type transport system involved in cytochrome c biogenesis ATPase subunit
MIRTRGMSHGESFLALIRNRFGPDGLYILDEPEAALSPAKQITLLARMHDLFQAAGMSTVVCGPGSITQAHRPDESISLDELAAGERFVRGFIDWAENEGFGNPLGHGGGRA